MLPNVRGFKGAMPFLWQGVVCKESGGNTRETKRALQDKEPAFTEPNMPSLTALFSKIY